MHSRKSDILIGLVLILLTAVAYSPVRHHEFIHFDDDVYITGNPHIRAGLTIAGLKWALTTTHAEFWHPLTWLSHMLDCELFGLNSGLHHLSSLLLHVLNALLLYAVLFAMTGNRIASAAVAALFALHPLHVESVAWAAERKDVLGAFFGFLCLLTYVRYVRHPGPGRYLVVTILFFCSLAAKPMLVTLPFLLLLLDHWPLKRLLPENANVPRNMPLLPYIEKIPLLAVSIVFAIVTIHAQRQSGYLMPLEAIPLGGRIANALVSYIVYMGKTVWPHPLAIIYPRPESMPIWQSLSAGLLLLAISAMVIGQVRRRPWLAIGWFWFLIALLPVIGLIQISTFDRADRYTYLPLTGLFIMLAWSLPDFTKRPPIRKAGWIAVALVLLASMTLKTFNQVSLWRDSRTLFTHALRVTTNNYMAHAALGVALAESGQLDEAVRHYQAAMQLKPDYAVVYNDLGIIHLQQGDMNAAIREFRRAVELKPDYATALSNLGAALVYVHEFDQAVAYLQKAIAINPLDAGALINMAAAAANTGRFENAAVYLQKALALEPHHPTALQLLRRIEAQQSHVE